MEKGNGQLPNVALLGSGQLLNVALLKLSVACVMLNVALLKLFVAFLTFSLTWFRTLHLRYLQNVLR